MWRYLGPDMCVVWETPVYGTIPERNGVDVLVTRYRLLRPWKENAKSTQLTGPIVGMLAPSIPKFSEKTCTVLCLAVSTAPKRVKSSLDSPI